MDPVSRWRRPWEEGPSAPPPCQSQPNLRPVDRTGYDHQHYAHSGSGISTTQPIGATSPVSARAGPTHWKEEPSTQHWIDSMSDNTPGHVRTQQQFSPESPRNKRRRVEYNPRPAPAAREGFTKAPAAHGPGYYQPVSPQMAMNRAASFGASQLSADRPCCDSHCRGRVCSTRRAILAEVLHLIQDLHSKINQHANPSHPVIVQPKPPRLSLDDGLAFALETLRVSAVTLQQLGNPPEPKPESRPPTMSNAAALDELRNEMKLRAEQINLDQRSAAAQPPSIVGHDPFRTNLHPNFHEVRRRSSSVVGGATSPHASPTTASRPHPGLSAAQISPPAPAHQASRMLPSPTSSHIPPPSTIQSFPSPPPSLSQPQSSAHLAHLAALQHQISLKTLALQTLRQEYDALLAKLDRQRTKCSTLEKKFAVSDVELNALTVDKEELESKTQALEQQVEELRESRDEARRGEVRTSAQYRTIVEMASRLQKGAAEERRAWAAEREALVRAARGDPSSCCGEQGGLKSHAVDLSAETSIHSPPFDDESGPARTTSAPDISSDLENASNQVIEALRVEVAQLRSRNQSLEAVLQKLQVEMEPLRSAVCLITETQTRMEEAAREALRVA
ncbi:uncharacterized protein J3D65DRAFT_336771 [Phyllosticta citribraziliensis]|uniref:Uncharacterized protein n=1 Tax=Phyllosticta citribraziliensis TaxID=989973 RepID=A0ABR1LX13_9PEZI